MPFLVRKLNKMDKLSVLADANDINKLDADIPTTEFRTTDGRLSTWIIDSLDKLDDAVLAIAVTSSEISKMDFIIISTELLSEHHLDYEQTYAGQDIAVPDLQNTHYDILNVSVEKLAVCTEIYQTIVREDPDCEKYIIRFASGDIRDILNKALKDNRIDKSKASKSLSKELSRLNAG